MTELIALGVVVAGAVVALAWLADRRRCAVCNRPCPGTPANEEIGTVIADRAYDTRRSHTHGHHRPAGHSNHPDPQERAAVERGARPQSHETKSSAPPGTTAGHIWKRCTGYQVRSRIEAKTRCLKAYDERIAAETLTAEIQIRIALMNRLSALGTAEIIRVA